eukprot:7099957-Pyramimonas_sp.AAC.1
MVALSGRPRSGRPSAGAFVAPLGRPRSGGPTSRPRTDRLHACAMVALLGRPRARAPMRGGVCSAVGAPECSWPDNGAPAR